MLRGNRTAVGIVLAAALVAGAWSISPVAAQTGGGTEETTVPPNADTTPNDPNGDGTSGQTVPNDPNGDGTSGQTIPNDPNGPGGTTPPGDGGDPNAPGTTATTDTTGTTGSTATTGPDGQAETGASTSTTASTVAGTPLTRLAGTDRSATAIAVSRSSFPDAGSAQVVVLASATRFPDALAGTPLAGARGGPVLLTGGVLEQAVRGEIGRVLPTGGSVVIVGGTVAVPDAVATALRDAGFLVTRIAGADRFATSVQVAQAMGDPSTLLLATGLDFPDALSAGAVGAFNGAAVVLTAGRALDPAVRDYVAAHAASIRYAVGGAAAQADPGATAVSGIDRYDTSRRVAERFFPQAPVVGLATGRAFPDALAGGAHAGRLRGPLLLTDSAQLQTPTREYLASVRGARGYIYGGTAAVSEAVATQAANALR